MKLKKAGALGLSCVIALGSMAGCGSSKEKEKTDGKEEISLFILCKITFNEPMYPISYFSKNVSLIWPLPYGFIKTNFPSY